MLSICDVWHRMVVKLTLRIVHGASAILTASGYWLLSLKYCPLMVRTVPPRRLPLFGEIFEITIWKQCRSQYINNGRIFTRISLKSIQLTSSGQFVQTQRCRRTTVSICNSQTNIEYSCKKTWIVCYDERTRDESFLPIALLSKRHRREVFVTFA